MKLKDWFNYKKTFTRKELIFFGFLCSFPFGIIGWGVSLIAIILKPHDPKGKWKK